MATGWINSFIESLERLIEKPPYLIFVFIGAIFVIVSLISQYNFNQVWVFFLYSVIGTIWRYIERDFFRPLEGKIPNAKLLIITIYHIGNVGLIVALLKYLKFI